MLLANRPHFTHLFIAHRRISCVRFDSLLESYLCLQLSISRRVGELESFEECAFALLRGQVSQVLTNGVLLARRRLEHLFLSHSLLVHLREARRGEAADKERENIRTQVWGKAQFARRQCAGTSVCVCVRRPSVENQNALECPVRLATRTVGSIACCSRVEDTATGVLREVVALGAAVVLRAAVTL
jgi:hypothetical protein